MLDDTKNKIKSSKNYSDYAEIFTDFKEYDWNTSTLHGDCKIPYKLIFDRDVSAAARAIYAYMRSSESIGIAPTVNEIIKGSPKGNYSINKINKCLQNLEEKWYITCR